LGIFEDGDQVMKLDHSIQDEAILKYKNTFFQAHSRILGNVLDKYRALIRFDLSDPIKELTIDDVRNYLKSKTAE
jgi:hypothetical protein